MWSIAVYDYGLTTEQFKRLTPAQFYALSKRYDANKKQQDYGFGIVASVIANCNRNPDKQKKPFTPEDFVPVYEKKRKAKGSMKQEWDVFVRPTANFIATQQTKKKKRGGG